MPGKKAPPKSSNAGKIKRMKAEEEPPPPAKTEIGKVILSKVEHDNSDILTDDDGGYYWTSKALSTVSIGDLLADLRPHWPRISSTLRQHPLLGIINSFTAATHKREYKKKNWFKQTAATDNGTKRKDCEIEKALSAVVEEVRGMLRNGSGHIILPVYPDFCIFALSGFIESLSELLRNDSLTDMSGRPELYHQVFEFIKGCSSSNDFAALFCAEGKDNGAPIASLLATMNEQANVFLRSRQQIEENAGDEEMVVTIDISMSIRDSIEKISASNVQMKQKTENIEEKYIARLTSQRLEMVNMFNNKTKKYLHAYDADLRKDAKSVGSAAGRMKELSTLTTTLPVSWGSSVFIRADENRNDCLKALIIGPEGTPYQDGCFLFDIYLPPQYPSVPPLVKIVNTSNGNIRFNPNLYANGKVCLSLLGTWQGPSWIPGKSTLLQVLVSIQGLILVQDPMDNEPGVTGSAKEHTNFNTYMRYFTCKGAMLEILQSNNQFFGAVIKDHFRLKREAITTQLNTLKKDVKNLGKKPPHTFGFPRGDFGAGDSTEPTVIVDRALQFINSLN